jgi:hypothetical protein
MKSLCISLGHRGPERGLYATHAHNMYNAYKMKMTETIHKTKKPSPTTIPGSARQDLLNVCFCWLWICSPFFSFSAMRTNIISHSAICSMGAKSPPFAFFSLADAFMLVWSGHLQRVSRLCSFIHSSPYGKVRAFTPCGGHTPCASIVVARVAGCTEIAVAWLSVRRLELGAVHSVLDELVHCHIHVKGDCGRQYPVRGTVCLHFDVRTRRIRIFCHTPVCYELSGSHGVCEAQETTLHPAFATPPKRWFHTPCEASVNDSCY